jgi:hypothetical protein
MAIGASDFQTIYHLCFTHYFNDDIDKVRVALPNLLLIQDEQKDKRNEKVLEAITKIRQILVRQHNGQEHPALKQLRSNSTSVNSAKTFWMIFSASEFDTMARVKDLFVDRIKALQDDLRANGVIDKASLLKFLDDYESKNQKELSSKPPSKAKGGYFVPGQDSQVPVLYGNERWKGQAVGFNMYSEKDICSLQFDLASQVRNVRDSFSAQAQRGELITTRFTIDIDKGCNSVKIILESFDPKMDTPYYPYVTTFNALVYNEIVNRRIHSKNDIYTFSLKLRNDKRFKFEQGELSFEQFYVLCANNLDQFDDAFKFIQDKKSATGD